MQMSYQDTQQFPEFSYKDYEIRSLYDYQPANIDIYLNLEQPSSMNHQQDIMEIIDKKQDTTAKYSDVIENKILRYWQKNNDSFQTDDPKQIYQNQTREDKLTRYFQKKSKRVWKKKVKYFSRQKVANGRQRVNGKFISGKKIKQQSPLQTKQEMNQGSFSPTFLSMKNQATSWPEP